MGERLSGREMETNGTDSTLQSFSSCVTVLSVDDIFRWETPGCGCRRLGGDARRRSLVVQCARIRLTRPSGVPCARASDSPKDVTCSMSYSQY